MRLTSALLGLGRRLVSGVAGMFKTNSKVNSLKQKRDSIQRRLSNQENKIRLRRVDLETIRKKLRNCNETLANLNIREGGLQKEIDSKRSKLNENAREKERLNSQLTNLRTDLNRKDTEMDTKTENLDRLTQNSNDLTDRIFVLNDAISNRNDEFQEKKTVIENKKNELNCLKKDIEGNNLKLQTLASDTRYLLRSKRLILLEIMEK